MKTILVSITLLAPCAAISQTNYICIPSKAGGFYYNNATREWSHAQFAIGDEKYILKNIGKSWQWTRFGDSWGPPCGDFDQNGYLQCQVLGGTLRMNKNNLRYLLTYEFGYLDGKDNNENTPSIKIGKCSPL